MLPKSNDELVFELHFQTRQSEKRLQEHLDDGLKEIEERLKQQLLTPIKSSFSARSLDDSLVLSDDVESIIAGMVEEASAKEKTRLDQLEERYYFLQQAINVGDLANQRRESDGEDRIRQDQEMTSGLRHTLDVLRQMEVRVSGLDGSIQLMNQQIVGVQEKVDNLELSGSHTASASAGSAYKLSSRKVHTSQSDYKQLNSI